MTTREPNALETPSSDSNAWGAPSGPPKPPALRAPAEPWRSANVQSEMPDHPSGVSVPAVGMFGADLLLTITTLKGNSLPFTH